MRIHEVISTSFEEMIKQAQDSCSELENHCDIASKALAKILAKHGHHGSIVNGVFIFPNGWEEGHHFIVLDDLTLLDPTRGQFDDGPMVLNDFTEQDTYRIDNEIARF